MSSAIVSHVFFGSLYFLARDPDEWVMEQEKAARFDPFIAKRIADSLGGTVVLLDQRRTVAGTLGRENDGGRRT